MTAAVIAAAVLSAAGTGLYLARTPGGSAEPQAVSWLIWAAIMTIGGVAALGGGQLPAGVYGLACGAGCAAIAAMTLRHGLHLDLLGAACLAGGAAGLVLLVTARSPALAVAATVTADLAGFIPTYRHAWTAPRREVASAYALFALGAGLSLAVADLHSFTATAYPAYLLVADGAAAVLIVARRAAAGHALTANRQRGHGHREQSEPAR